MSNVCGDIVDTMVRLAPPLGEPATTDANGMVVFRFRTSDFSEHTGEGAPDLHFQVSREKTALDYALVGIENDGGVIRHFKPQPGPVVLRIDRPYVIAGTILHTNGLPVQGLLLSIYQLGFGGKAQLLGRAITDGQGQYALTYDPGTAAPNLEVRIQDPAGTGKELALSKPIFGAHAYARVNLVVPDAPHTAEYQALAADIAPQVGDLASLAGARENHEQHDLTLLNRITGWDARLIAVAAMAARLTTDKDLQIAHEAAYGLLRAGLPSEKRLLARVAPAVARQALETARKSGIVQLKDEELDEFQRQFTTFATNVRLAMPAPGSESTYGQLLEASGVSADAQAVFAPLYLNHQGAPDQLWENARKAGLKEEEISRLQLQGKFAFLAGNSEAMTRRLLEQEITDPAQLVDRDFHLPDQWRAEVRALAGDDEKALASIIPTAYVGEKVEDRLNAYAEDMARKVRLSYPTHVVARLIEQDKEQDLFNLGDAREHTVTMLRSAAHQGFRLGQTPVANFFRTHLGATDGMSEEDAQGAVEQVKRLQRVYQITPSNEAMPVLFSLGMHSAYDVTGYSEALFMERYNAKYLDLFGKAAPSGEAGLIYRKAQQVSSVTYHLFTTAKKLASDLPVHGVAAPPEVRENLQNELIKQFPTMESLFGSTDYCECEHCRSVLSPAAYLVDLLQFVDPEDEEWTNFLDHWTATHDGQAYTAKYKKPYDALLERRPDLPHIPLTCENTNTALPYIDVVNEILEYYVANGKLTENAACDTGEASTAELLAEPQNVIRTAYDKLEAARYPLTLPFDRSLEVVRQFCNYFETPLSRLLELFHPIDPAASLDDSTCLEALGLSPAEAGIFTEAHPLENHKWFELYGYPTLEAAIQSPTNAGNAALTVANADAAQFRAGMACTYFDVSANAMHGEALVVSAIGAANSGGAGQTKITFTGVWTTAPVAGDRLLCDAPAMLKSAKALARRLGVTYKEMVELVQTGFVNPELQKLAVLYKLGVSIGDARFYSAHKALIPLDPATLTVEEQQQRLEAVAFAQRVQGLANAFGVSTAQIENALAAIPYAKVLVLADPDAGGDFDRTTLQYADGGAADPIAYLRINLFVRLWRKLGWSMEETDRALQAFVPQHAPFDAAHLALQPLRTALVYMAHLKALDETLSIGKQSRLKLITLWADLPTTGKRPLYAQLFLNRNVLKSDPVFDHPLGQYLSAGSPLKHHMTALQAALSLSADEIRRILKEAGHSLDTTVLTMANVSLLYRYGLLAKGLKLSVRDLIDLKGLTGLDPFKPLSADPLAKFSADSPFTQTLPFVAAAAAVKASGLKIEDLEYLLRHRFDPTGPYRPDPEGTLALLKTLSGGVRAIRAEHAVPADPGAMSDEVLRRKLGLVLPADVATRLLAMLNGSVEFTATNTGVAASDQLQLDWFKAPETADQPAIRTVHYNAARQEQTILFRGVLFNAQKTKLQDELPESASAQTLANLTALLNDVQNQAQQFFANYLQKQTGLQPAVGFLDAADFDLLFNLQPTLNAGETDQDHARTRRAKLVGAFLPFLQERLTRQFVVQTMTAYTGADPALVESLVTDARLLAGPGPLQAAFAGTAARGVTATFYTTVDGSGEQLGSITLATPDTGLRDQQGNLLRPAGAQSACLEGYLEVPAPGAYRFYLTLEKQAAEAELRFAHLPNPVFSGTALADGATLGDQPDEYVELKPGTLYHFTLKLGQLNGGDARLLVQGETLPKGALDQLPLYPQAAVAAAERALVLLSKAMQLVRSLGLNEREVRYLLTHASAFGDLNLSDLPVSANEDSDACAKALFGQFLRLAGYARLKTDLAAGADNLIDIFTANETGDLTRVYPLIAQLTRREEPTVIAVAEELFAAPDFASEEPLQRLWEGLQVVERFGVQVASLVEWTGIASAGATAEQRFAIAQGVKEVVKACFDPEAWQNVAQPIFDKLRQRQRDALVAYIMHQQGFGRMEQLYEYFLIDPGMEPVVQTSRIRLAIGSVQLFIQRCLLNLEPQVHPSVINAKQWEWMKRYRVWEANRKIFLFPENWLEPEFRDDKTHLFSELEGTLLQGDVSGDMVEDAFLNYLRKLDELARLDIVAMHLEENADAALRTLHVIGRTYGLPHKYFYRRYSDRMWTPWEPVSAEIEGDHLVPVVWRDRLYLFWLTFLEKPLDNPLDTAAADPGKAPATMTFDDLKEAARGTVDVQLHWSEYLDGKWSTRESGGFAAVVTSEVAHPFEPRSVFVHVSKAYEAGEERGVYIHLAGEINQAFYLAGRNATPESVKYLADGATGARPENPYGAVTAERATRYEGTGALTVTFTQRISTEPGATPNVETPSILQQGIKHTLLACNNNIETTQSSKREIASLVRPVFYQDNAYTLFVEPTVVERTVEEWQDWVTHTPEPETDWKLPDWWEDLVLVPQNPIFIDKGDPWVEQGNPAEKVTNPGSLVQLESKSDWLANAGTGLLFDGVLVGATGQAGVEIRTAGTAAPATAGGIAVTVHPGSGLAAGTGVFLTGGSSLAEAGLKQVSGALNVVGASGFNKALAQNFTKINQTGVGAVRVG
ncbi:MAG TPA: neuraminidase-like domain-containing protein [Symbiobacteriaceae bacterium]|nr:neuraminidase-like domain-containing protein [Symbiobacteriaceae bacterium]